MIDERTEELAAAYVLGALEPEETKLIERQLQSDPELRHLVAELRGVGQHIAGTSPAVEPSAALKARLLLELGLGASPRPSSRPRLMPLLPWALAAGFAALCVFFGWQTYTLRTRLDARAQRIEELGQLVGSLRAESATLRQSVLTLQQSNRLANVRIAVLSAQLHTDPKAVAVSVWDNERQSGVLVLHHLKPPPKDKDYQLWIIDPRYPAPVDAGVLSVDEAGDGRADFTPRRPIQSANQFAITEEVKGGSPVPTLSAMVLAGA